MPTAQATAASTYAYAFTWSDKKSDKDIPETSCVNRVSLIGLQCVEGKAL